MSGTESESEDGSHKGDEDRRDGDDEDLKDDLTPIESAYVASKEGEMGEVSFISLLIL